MKIKTCFTSKTSKSLKCKLFLSECVGPGKFRIHSRYKWVPEKNCIPYLETPVYAIWFPYQFNDSCYHILVDFKGTRKQTSFRINRQLNEICLIHGVMLSLQNTSKKKT